MYVMLNEILTISGDEWREEDWVVNWCGDVTEKKLQREPHLQNVAVGLEGRLPDCWSSDRRDINATDVEKQIRT